ncbi:MAG: cytochrome P450, partial [SAR324 cluster bacterium]|nr:cytochrome P450 [SAR324 cluster bacterium]
MSPTQPELNPQAAPAADAAERAAALAFDPLNLPAGFLENPFPTYHLLRWHDPVHRCPDGS